MILYRSHGLTIAELWFDESIKGISPDIIRWRQSLVPLTNGTSTDFYTLVLDLALSEQELSQKMSKENRYEVRRAQEKDGVSINIWDGKEKSEVNRFFDFYNQFAVGKGLPTQEKSALDRMIEAQHLAIFRVNHSDGSPLTYHAYYVNESRARLLFSASLFRASSDGAFRSLVGRANRWLHWQGICHFKKMGKKIYDFGGWYEGTTDEARLQINKFKESFGGTIERNYNGEELLTLRAKAARGVQRLLLFIKCAGRGT